jgi:hypothetical protein
MAVRFIPFKELSAALESGKRSFRPGGCLGSHSASLVRRDDGIVATGSRAGSVFVTEGRVLGYNCGEVWLKPLPSQYSCPVRRLLAEKNLSQKILVVSDKVPDFGPDSFFSRFCRSEDVADIWVKTQPDMVNQHGRYVGKSRRVAIWVRKGSDMAAVAETLRQACIY